MLMETKGNSENGIDKEEGKNDAGATPLKTTLIGEASGPGPYYLDIWIFGYLEEDHKGCLCSR